MTLLLQSSTKYNPISHSGSIRFDREETAVRAVAKSPILPISFLKIQLDNIIIYWYLFTPQTTINVTDGSSLVYSHDFVRYDFMIDFIWNIQFFKINAFKNRVFGKVYSTILPTGLLFAEVFAIIGNPLLMAWPWALVLAQSLHVCLLIQSMITHSMS